MFNVHFNKNRPQYHNIYSSNVKGKHIYIYDGERWKLVDKLIERSEKVYIAGDDDQAIYQWAGADVNALLSRANREGSIKDVLKQSYRIPASVHPYAISLINRNKNREPKIWNPCKEKGLIKFPNYKDLSLFKKGQWLLLAPTGYHLDKMCSDMRNQGIYFLSLTISNALVTSV